MKTTRTLVAIALLSLILIQLPACKKGGKPGGKPSGDEKQPVMTELLQPRSLSEYITVSGKLEGSTDVMMVSETSGRILNLYKKLGDRINRGDKLGLVDNDVVRIRLEQAEAAENSAQAAFETAKLNLNTSEKLYQTKSISQVEYNSALSAFKGAKAGLDGARANTESARKAYDNSFLIAPESGVISNLMVSAGQYINPGTQIAYITDNKVLVIKTGVGETQIGKIRQGQGVDISIPGKDTPVRGFIKGFGIRPLPSAATYPIEIQLSGSTGLMPGMVATARIMSGVYNNLLYTSINNIVREFDRSYVFVVDKDGKALKKEIKTGKIIGENVVIESGVVVGDQLVTSGMENLEDGTKVQIRS